MLGLQVLPLVTGAQLQAQVDAAARSYGQQLVLRYPDGVPAGTVLGDPGPSARPGGRGDHGRRHAGYPGDHRPGPGQPGGHRGRRGGCRRHGSRVVGTVAVPGRKLGERPPRRPGDADERGLRQGQRRVRALPHAVRHRALRGLLARGPRRPRPPVARRPATGRVRLRPGALGARVHQPRQRLGRARPARRDRLAGVLAARRAAHRDRAGRRAVRAARLLAPRPPGAPPGTSHPRGRRRRLLRHPARFGPGRGRPPRGQLQQHDQAA